MITIIEQSEKINVINNIINMQTVIGGIVDTFETLNQCTLNNLQCIQDGLIPDYNKAIETRNYIKEFSKQVTLFDNWLND